MYTLFIGKNNCIVTTNAERIVQKSKLANTVQIYVTNEYNGVNMQDCLAILYYRTPASGVWKSKELTPSEELYKETYVEYLIPADTWLTAEAGDVQIEIKFYKVEMGGTQDTEQYVRKATDGVIHISSSKDWASGIADSLLDTIDQRIIQLMMLQNMQEEMLEEQQNNCAASLAVTDGKLHLVNAAGETKGDSVDIVLPRVPDESDGSNDGVIEVNSDDSGSENFFDMDS